MKRIGVLGCGYWGAKHARVLNELPNVVLHRVADVDAIKAQAIAEKYPGVAWTTSLEALLTDPELDGLIIATPASTHAQLALKALAVGKHVMVEKPLALYPDQAQALIDEAQANKLTLMVGHTFEYHPAVHALHQIVQEGTLGRLYYLDIARLNLGLYQRDVNVIYDLSPHDISIMIYVLGERPIAVNARGYSMVHRGVVDVAYIEYHFASGLVANSRVSWLSPNKVRELTLVGSNRMAVYNDITPEAMLQIHDRGIVPPTETENFTDWKFAYQYGATAIVPLPLDEPLKTEIQHFVDCITTGRTPLTDGRNGQQVVAVLHAAQQSLLHGGRYQAVDYADAPRTDPASLFQVLSAD